MEADEQTKRPPLTLRCHHLLNALAPFTMQQIPCPHSVPAITALSENTETVVTPEGQHPRYGESHEHRQVGNQHLALSGVAAVLVHAAYTHLPDEKL